MKRSTILVALGADVTRPCTTRARSAPKPRSLDVDTTQEHAKVLSFSYNGRLPASSVCGPPWSPLSVIEAGRRHWAALTFRETMSVHTETLFL